MAKYKAYPEYKDSGVESVGVIPQQWSVLKLKYIFEIKKRIAGKIGYDVLSVTQKGIKIKDIDSGEGQLSMDYSKYQRVYTGEFAMNHMDLLTGYVDISAYNGVTSPDYRVFSVRDKHSFYSRYYLYLLQDGYKQRRFFHLGQGSAHLGRWRLPTEAFNEIQYPCPSFEEQTQIAAFLDHETAKIDNLIDKQKQLIELLKEKRQAVISHAVTKGLNPDVPMKDSGVEWLGEVPEHWVVSAIKYILRNQDSRRIPLSSEERGKRGGDYRYYGASGVIDYVDDYIFDEPTILVGEDGANLVTRNTPLAFSAKGKYWVNNHAHILKSEDELVDFWSEAIEHIDISPIVSGSAQPKLTAEALNNLKIAYSYQINERSDIEEYIITQRKKYDHLICAANEQVILLQERRTALISAAVTGKIDVRNWVALNTQDVEESQEAAA
ncbi:restriction endonuclease subunit S [Xenorhabdus sp. IM139775]|uniref:restriction endonuclease subunit S n=1 Tax=Xenorhabdus sp. IM139775 TaxID=3025876 RepID=UPI00235814C1|nr:restriction endonuclease subunit S [Xenorhabdus sp. IM139775]MDC9592738.1 restriction endonuclease subunit S [Xenorhabdus sp. IM139775]